ncbi:hypothetical protein EFA46_008350 [Halarchaeum sp. CBA1220]|uniref:hypothetical protein n=1 Tax=Halarchaeum sp. CBA1220 TaxID=1853682 RepID=UPI000F3A9BCB|nr:hypothetical protein [Halarchaeum sp. CBA1220]QLC34215.1 hypothetical protein EFA46_008350 [Halarchaeum sp. CBA1220]
MAEKYERLVRLVENRAGDAFRGAIRYHEGGHTILYLRDDIATDAFRDAVDGLIERARAYEPLSRPESYPTLGATQASVELYEAAAVIHFREGPNTGILVSLDRDVAQGLGAFVTRCTSVLVENGGVEGADGPESPD